MARMEIQTPSRVTVGFIDTDASGNKTVMDFSRKILGYYDASRNVTTNFYRSIVAYGDATGVFFKDDIRF